MKVLNLSKSILSVCAAMCFISSMAFADLQPMDRGGMDRGGMDRGGMDRGGDFRGGDDHRDDRGGGFRGGDDRRDDRGDGRFAPPAYPNYPTYPVAPVYPVAPIPVSCSFVIPAQYSTTGADMTIINSNRANAIAQCTAEGQIAQNCQYFASTSASCQY